MGMKIDKIGGHENLGSISVFFGRTIRGLPASAIKEIQEYSFHDYCGRK